MYRQKFFFEENMRLAAKVLLWILAVLIALMLGLALYINSPLGQKTVRNQLDKFIGNKINTEYHLGEIKYSIPDWIIINDLYLEDQSKDTLVKAAEIRIDLDMLALLKSTVAINKVELKDGLVKLYNTENKSEFNYQFLIDAFAGDSTSEEPTQAATATSENNFNLSSAFLENTRFEYTDFSSGIIFKTKLGEAAVDFNEIDLNKNLYDIQKVEVQKSLVSFTSFPPTLPSENSEESEPLNLNVGRTLFEDISWVYNGRDVGIENKIDVEKAEVRFEEINLTDQRIILAMADFDKADIEVFMKKPELLTEPSEEPAASWKISGSDIDLKNSRVHYKDLEVTSNGNNSEFNPSDILLSESNISLASFLYNGNEISGIVKPSSFKEQSGLIVSNLSTEFAYTDKLISLKEFQFNTRGSELDTDLSIAYQNLDAFIDSPQSATIDLNLRKANLLIEDLFHLSAALKEYPTLLKNRSKKLVASGNIKGKNGDFLIDKFKINLGPENRINLDGYVAGVTNLQNLKTDLTISNSQLQKDLLLSLIPEDQDLSDYQIPPKLGMEGKITGNEKAVDIDAKFITDYGNLNFDGIIENVSSDSLRSFAGNIMTEKFQVNKFFVEDMGLGMVSADIKLAADATFSKLNAEGYIAEIEYQNYLYRNINLNAAFADSVVTLTGNSTDANANMTADFTSNLRSEQMSFDGILNIKNLNLARLNLAEYENDVKGEFVIDMNYLNHKALEGNLAVSRLKVGSAPSADLKALFTHENNIQKADINSPFFGASLQGDGNLEDIYNTINEAFQSRVDSAGMLMENVRGEMKLKGKLLWHPIWTELVPEMRFEQPIVFNGGVKNGTYSADITMNSLTYDLYTINGLYAEMMGQQGALAAETLIEDIDLDGYNLRENQLNFFLDNSVASVRFESRDSTNSIKHAADFKYSFQNEHPEITINELTFEGNVFDSNKETITFSNFEKVLVNNLTLKNKEQQIRINGSEEQLNLDISNFQISPLYEFYNTSDIKVNGLLYANVQLENELSNIKGKANIRADKLTVDNESIGEITVDVKELTEEGVTVKGAINGARSMATFDGKVSLDEALTTFMNIDLERLDAAFIKAFSFGQVTKASGIVNGNIKLNGSLTDPEPVGFLGFKKFKITPAYLGVPLAIDGQEMKFNKKQINLNNFVVQDSLNQKMIFDGNVNWASLEAIRYNLSLKTTDFLLLSTTAQDNDLVYGTLKLDSNLKIKGVGDKPSVDGRIRIREKSDITFVMPTEIQTAESQGIVYFVPPADSSNAKDYSAKPDSVSSSGLTELLNEILIEVETDEKANFVVVVDELNGDQLQFKGTSNLTFGLYPNGEPYLIGSFDLLEGSYDFSLQVFKREFKILKGSTLSWNGDPYEATLDIQASYEVNTDIQSLNAFGLEVNQYGKVPIDVLLKLTGTIEEPIVNFDIKVSDKAESSITSLVESYNIFAGLRSSESEMNQQVFSLILFNRFLSASAVSSSNVFNTESVARQSVSKLLTEQLNVLAGNVFGNVGINFGLNSSVLAGEQGNASRTEFNVGLNQTFLKDRVHVSVGKNFELANTTGVDQNSAEILDNIDVEYFITPDGRYILKAYRNNEYQTVLEGFVVQTGVGFELRANYDKFKEIFKKKRNE